MERLAVLAAVLLAAHGAAAWPGPNRHLAQFSSCLQSVLVLPELPGESIESKLTASAPTPLVGPSGSCVAVAGRSTLVKESDNTLFSLSGTLTLWVNATGPTSSCPDETTVATGVERFLAVQGLLVATANWTSVTCCDPNDATSCPASDVALQHSPLLNSETPARDWVVLDGYSMASAAPLRPSNVSAGLFGSPEDARFATWQDCRQNCSRTPGCASFRWVRTTRACLHYRNEPNATNLLRPCTNADGTRCKFGYRIPGLCGRTASQSISHSGKHPRNWIAAVGSFGIAPELGFYGAGPVWSMLSRSIPDDLQGQPSPSVSECACRCSSVAFCVGYVFLGNNQTCWLMDIHIPWVPPADDPYPDTLMGRVYTGAPLGLCSSIQAFANLTIPNIASSRITTTPEEPSTLLSCYRDCGADPACMAPLFTTPPTSANAFVANGTCTLISEVDAPNIAAANFSYPAFFLRCDNATDYSLAPWPPVNRTATWSVLPSTPDALAPLRALPDALTAEGTATTSQPTLSACAASCRSTTGCGVAVYEPASTSCSLAYLAQGSTLSGQEAPTLCEGGGCSLVSHTPGDCGLVASSGIVGPGQAWAGWQPGDTSGDWGSTEGIPDSFQGQVAVSPSDCLCRCSKVMACIAYVFLGVERTCWLQSFVNVTAELEQDNSPLTVTGRLELQRYDRTNCTDANITVTSDVLPSNPSSDAVLRTPNPFPVDTVAACNEACLMEPFCVAFSVGLGEDDTSEQQQCTLYSSALGDTTVQSDTVTAFVQRCPVSFEGSAEASPPPLPPSPFPPPALAGCQQTAVVLPDMRGETLESTFTTAGPGGSGACVAATGSAMLVLQSDSTAYKLTGTVVMWMPSGDGSSACPANLDIQAAVGKYLEGQGLLPGAANWTSVTCCDPNNATSCPTSSVTLQHSPLLNSETPARDWVVVDGYTMRAALPLQRSNLSGTLFGSPEGAAFATWQECRQNCSRTPGCAAFQWSAGAQSCQHYTNEPNATNLLEPCAAAGGGGGGGCTFGYRLAGLCGRTASHSITWTGMTFYTWQPGLNGQSVADASGLLQTVAWSMDPQYIPSNAQARPTASVSECACRCASVSYCVGYMYRAGDQTCWMVDSLTAWVLPSPSDNPDDILGRVDTGRPLQTCGGQLAFTPSYSITSASSSRISVVPAVPFTSTVGSCYFNCTADPACQAAQFTVEADVDITGLSASNTGSCSLFSEVGSYIRPANSSLVVTVQRCDPPTAVSLAPYPFVETRATWTAVPSTLTTIAQLRPMPDALTTTARSPASPATPASRKLLSAFTTQQNASACLAHCRDVLGCGAAVYDPANSACILTYFVQGIAYNETSSLPLCSGTGDGACVVATRSPGSCGLSASSGVVGAGRRWRGWAPGAASGAWGSAAGIEPESQGRAASCASDCLCRCERSPRCVAYVFLGVERTCWLQSVVNVTAGLEADNSPLTVTGRVEPLGKDSADCGGSSLRLVPGQSPTNGSLVGILRTPNPFPTSGAADCNAACLMEPFCQGFAVDAGASTCTLYSTATLGTSNATAGVASSFVQRCVMSSSVGMVIPGLVTPSPPFIVGPGPMPQETSSSSSGSSSLSTGAIVGISIGAAVGGLLILGLLAALIVVLRRRKRREGYMADAPVIMSANPAAYDKHENGATPFGNGNGGNGDGAAGGAAAAAAAPAAAGDRGLEMLALSPSGKYGSSDLGAAAAAVKLPTSPSRTTPLAIVTLAGGEASPEKPGGGAGKGDGVVAPVVLPGGAVGVAPPPQGVGASPFSMQLPTSTRAGSGRLEPSQSGNGRAGSAALEPSRSGIGRGGSAALEPSRSGIGRGGSAALEPSRSGIGRAGSAALEPSRSGVARAGSTALEPQPSGGLSRGNSTRLPQAFPLAGDDEADEAEPSRGLRGMRSGKLKGTKSGRLLEGQMSDKPE